MSNLNAKSDVARYRKRGYTEAKYLAAILRATAYQGGGPTFPHGQWEQIEQKFREIEELLQDIEKKAGE